MVETLACGIRLSLANSVASSPTFFVDTDNLHSSSTLVCSSKIKT